MHITSIDLSILGSIWKCGYSYVWVGVYDAMMEKAETP